MAETHRYYTMQTCCAQTQTHSHSHLHANAHSGKHFIVCRLVVHSSGAAA